MGVVEARKKGAAVPGPRALRLGEKLAHIRERLGLGPEALLEALGFAEGTGIRPEAVSCYESGWQEPPLTMLLAYARLAGVPVDDLIDDESEVSIAAGARPGGGAEEGGPPKIDAIEKETKSFTCPHCSTHLQFMVRVKVMGVREAGREGEQAAQAAPREAPPPPPPPRGFDERQRRFVEQARESGLLGAFEETLLATDGSVPKNVEAYFLTWIANATPAMVPRLALQTLVNAFGARARDIAAYTFQSVTAVVSMNRVRCFIPTRMLKGELLSAAKGSSLRLRIDPSERELSGWVRARGTAALAGGEFLRELQAQRTGHTPRR